MSLLADIYQTSELFCRCCRIILEKNLFHSRLANISNVEGFYFEPSKQFFREYSLENPWIPLRRPNSSSIHRSFRPWNCYIFIFRLILQLDWAIKFALMKTPWWRSRILKKMQFFLIKLSKITDFILKFNKKKGKFPKFNKKSLKIKVILRVI